MKTKPGDVIKVKVDGVEYDTIIDEHGVQRFKRNPVLDYFCDSGIINLNTVARHIKRTYGTKIVPELAEFFGVNQVWTETFDAD